MLSERSWRGEGVLRMFLGLIITLFALQTILASIIHSSPPSPSKSVTLQQSLLSMFLLQSAMFGWIIFFLRDQNLKLSTAFGLFQRIPKAVLLGLVTGLCVVPIAWFFQLLSVKVLNIWNLGPESQQVISVFRNAAKGQESHLVLKQVLFGISVVLLAPIAEETIFRGILYPTIKNIGFRRISMWLTAVLFSGMHANLAGLVSLMVLGVVLVIVYEETDNLIGPIIVHSVFNGTNFLVMLFEERFSKMLLPT